MLRREFLLATTQAIAASALSARAPSSSRVGLVPSSHSKLARPVSIEHPLDYELVRDMVWKAIDYGRPQAGSLAEKIPPGSWVVIKPNIVSIPPRPAYRIGDTTDLRVTRAILEYVARYSKAGRVTIAEGGSYRSVSDPTKDNAYSQNGQRADAFSWDWGAEHFPGFGGSISGMLADMAAHFSGKRFDYVDLSYDAVRDASGRYRRINVPVAANGVGAFGNRPDYYVTNTILNCDFLIDVPVAKVHSYSGITACVKNFVGTAPREAYAAPGSFSNGGLHEEQTVEGRIDPFLVDLAAFHPPDFNVVDGIRGLQYATHNNGRPDQMLRNNLVLAGEDAVAVDAAVGYLLGFHPWDLEFLHMAAQRGMGNQDFEAIDFIGDEPDRFRRPWAKTKNWYGRCNREWLVTRDPDAPLEEWTRHTIPTDTLHFARWDGTRSLAGATFGAAVRVRSEGHRKAYLWTGASGRVSAHLNGEKVLEREAVTRYRIGQFRTRVDLRPGENLLKFRVRAMNDEARLSALLVGPRNNGDTVEGIRWSV